MSAKAAEVAVSTPPTGNKAAQTAAPGTEVAASKLTTAAKVGARTTAAKKAQPENAAAKKAASVKKTARASDTDVAATATAPAVSEPAVSAVPEPDVLEPAVSTAREPDVNDRASEPERPSDVGSRAAEGADAPSPSVDTNPPSVPKKTSSPPPVAPVEEPWTDEELDEIRNELDSEIVRLRGEIEAAETDLADRLRDGGDGAGDDQADAGTKTFEREHEMSLANNARDLLVQTQHALARIDAGTYGRCENCGNPIGKLRLQANPRATLCVSCKQREERR